MPPEPATPTGPPTPELTTVVVTPHRFQQLRRTVRHLRQQSAAARMELVVVAPRESAIHDHHDGELDGFAAVKVVEAGPIPNVDKASAHGIHAATAPAVALVEDHAFCQPGWAEAIIDAHRGPEEVIGSVILNGNPDRMLSWVNLLVAYGPWTDGTLAGSIDCLPGHNITYKRDVLLSYGDRLPERLGRDGGLLDDLAGAGARFQLRPDAQIAHVNPSILSATTDLRFNAGRLYGHMRATSEDWSLAKRALYIAGGPAIPLVRLRRFWAEYFASGRRTDILPRILPALALGLALDGIGQVVGYAAGPGGSVDKLATFEMDRRQHITARERAEIDA
jgi:hypothetical protein